ncbi:MAG: SPOR domain-containing protein, partial [Oscillospiraceae bacterium]
AIKGADKPDDKPPILQSTGKQDDEVTEKADDKATGKPIYKVQVGAFANKSNAEKLLKELKNKGYEGIIK